MPPIIQNHYTLNDVLQGLANFAKNEYIRQGVNQQFSPYIFFIKSIRAFFGVGLCEAKDMADKFTEENYVYKLGCAEAFTNNFCKK